MFKQDKRSRLSYRSTFISALLAAFILPVAASAQTTESSFLSTDSARKPVLAADSPFQDPNVIYLEADALINDDDAQSLIARGNVIGRYQDRSLQADEVYYNTETGQVIATGNVILTDTTGDSQYADKLELSNELEAGTATNFTARFEEGGILGAAIVVRDSDKGVQLYNAYYTACEPCKGKKNPTWQIKSRRVKQNKDRNSIEYSDAVFQVFGIPVMYTPYLSHPDPSAKRASGWLAPYGTISGNKGVGIHAPYFVDLGRYAELTLTPHIYSGVNPLMQYDFRRKFYSGELNLNGSFTYASAFDRDGNAFDDPSRFTNPANATTGRRLRSHLFGNGMFNFTDFWTLGMGVQLASDDLYLDRYDLDQNLTKFGLYEADSRRLVSQLFLLGQNENTRVSMSAFGFQSLRTSIFENQTTNMFSLFSEDDSTLPIALPKIEANHFITDPLFKGRLEAYGDFSMLQRQRGEDYLRGTGGLNYAKTVIAPGGLEVKPFASARFDYIELDPENTAKTDFSRTLGQLGVDIRYPLVKSVDNVDMTIEPRVQVTQSFGQGELGNFSAIASNGTTSSLMQDSIGMDFDRANFWAENKSYGYDFWQKGFRADVGAAFTADWAKNRASLFLGQSYASDFNDDFDANTGLSGKSSDLVGAAELSLGNKLSLNTRVRYDDDDNTFRRIDTSMRYNGKRIKTNARYYRLNNAANANAVTLNTPAEEISGAVTVKLAKDWSARYKANHDIDAGVTRRQELGLIFDDSCTHIEIFYQKAKNNLGIVGNSSGIGFRVSLLTLGGSDY
ncbi:MAG: LPS-assembly protein LptD [Maricaulaceae bacterium]